MCIFCTVFTVCILYMHAVLVTILVLVLRIYSVFSTVSIANFMACYKLLSKKNNKDLQC